MEIPKPGDSGPSDVIEREKTGDRTTVKELTAEAIPRSGGNVNSIPQRSEPGGTFKQPPRQFRSERDK